MQNKYFQLVTELFIEKTLAYPTNVPSLGHIPCSDECWGWTIDLMLHHWRIWKEITICHLFWRSFIWSFDFGDFSIEVFKNFNEDLFIGDFSLKNWDFFFFFWRVILKIYPLNIWKLKYIYMYIYIYSWRFFLWNMEMFPWRFIQEIFPLQFWKTLMKICP